MCSWMFVCLTGDEGAPGVLTHNAIANTKQRLAGRRSINVNHGQIENFAHKEHFRTICGSKNLEGVETEVAPTRLDARPAQQELEPTLTEQPTSAGSEACPSGRATTEPVSPNDNSNAPTSVEAPLRLWPFSGRTGRHRHRTWGESASKWKASSSEPGLNAQPWQWRKATARNATKYAGQLHA